MGRYSSFGEFSCYDRGSRFGLDLFQKDGVLLTKPYSSGFRLFCFAKTLFEFNLGHAVVSSSSTFCFPPIKGFCLVGRGTELLRLRSSEKTSGAPLSCRPRGQMISDQQGSGHRPTSTFRCVIVARGFSSTSRFYPRAQSFTSAGGENTWETFTLSEPAEISGGSSVRLTAIKGPTFAHKPDYPALRVVDLQVLGERSVKGPGYFNVRAIFVKGLILRISRFIWSRISFLRRILYWRKKPKKYHVLFCLETRKLNIWRVLR